VSRLEVEVGVHTSFAILAMSQMQWPTTIVSQNLNDGTEGSDGCKPKSAKRHRNCGRRRIRRASLGANRTIAMQTRVHIHNKKTTPHTDQQAVHSRVKTF